ncbi:MAG TPA: diacylglycerol kinase family protein [Geomonas sp.]
MARRCFLIVNPTSGSFSPSRLELILAALRQSGLEPELLPTGNAGDATLFAARICAETADPLVLVAGGDGTVNGVLNGLVPGVATLGVIPLGTSNVLARELKLDSLDDALARVARGASRPISVGELECAGQRRRFLLMAGVGVDGAVVQGVRLREKRLVGKGAYLLSALRVLFGWDRGDLLVAGGGNSLSCHSVIVCNAARYGGNFLLAPRGGLFNPGFQVLCIRGGRLTYLKLALLLALGRVATSRSITSFQASELEISGDKAVQLDGDFFGSAPLRLRSIPDFVRLIV